VINSLNEAKEDSYKKFEQTTEVTDKTKNNHLEKTREVKENLKEKFVEIEDKYK
jgi:hypothetical protein